MMNTPIADFVRAYAKSNILRLHMPGHKGHSFLGCEAFDITEIKGADELYAADGIILESEQNAASLFGAVKTFYSTEGSSQCIRAMVYLAKKKSKQTHPYILAARNAHKALIYASALSDMDISWLYPRATDSLCSCNITAQQLEETLKASSSLPAAVYVTTPDYLGRLQPIRQLGEVCRKYGVPLLTDNAHGAYLHFLPERLHPLDLGADLCCDSAHKTLPVLTGGAYLHIGKNKSSEFSADARDALALFGTTSPSYLTMMSLDLCNAYLADGFEGKLQRTAELTRKTKECLRNNGWQIEETEPLKITVRCPENLSGTMLSEVLRGKGIECEYADSEYVVMMISAETSPKDLETLVTLFGKNSSPVFPSPKIEFPCAEKVLTVRDAVFSDSELLPVKQAAGRICASPTVSCPPAIPVVISGERISAEAVRLFGHYGITSVRVVKE